MKSGLTLFIRLPLLPATRLNAPSTVRFCESLRLPLIVLVGRAERLVVTLNWSGLVTTAPGTSVINCV